MMERIEMKKYLVVAVQEDKKLFELLKISWDDLFKMIKAKKQKEEQKGEK